MSDAPRDAGLIAAAGTVVSALWLALRGAQAANVARLEADLKASQERADRYEARADRYERKYLEIAAEIKAAASRRHSTPPGRGELPTYDAILDLRGGDVVAQDQAARQRAIDDELQAGIRDLPSLPPLAGVAPTTGTARRK